MDNFKIAVLTGMLSLSLISCSQSSTKNSAEEAKTDTNSINKSETALKDEKVNAVFANYLNLKNALVPQIVLQLKKQHRNWKPA